MTSLKARALPPVIKWPGSKRLIASVLGALFPADAVRYIEPFVGGGALLPFRPGRVALAGDTVAELVALWVEIRDRPVAVAAEYERRWLRLQTEGPGFFYSVRSRFNRTRDPHDLLLLSRTCVNGLIRFNAAGAFNNSLHHTRPGIAPGRLRPLVEQWSRAVQGVEFVSADYRETLAGAASGDFAFLDPPYLGSRGRYRVERLDFGILCGELERLNRIGVRWLLTLDGAAGSRVYEGVVPRNLWRARFALGTGHSPFTRLMRTGLDPVVEAVYLNYEPTATVAGSDGPLPTARTIEG